MAKAADYGISGRAVLVGGSAVNLHTGSYVPTDVDMCAYLDEADRASLRSLGFSHLQGDQFAYTFPDGEMWLLEFPDTDVDGTVSSISLDGSEVLDVISLESLMVNRLLQATDGTDVTFDESVRLAVVTMSTADWSVINEDVGQREARGEISGLSAVRDRVLEQAGDLLD